METTTATTIDDDSDDEGDTDGDGDDNDGHNGNDDKAATTRQCDETMISRYNNQLNGGPSAVER